MRGQKGNQGRRMEGPGEWIDWKGEIILYGEGSEGSLTVRVWSRRRSNIIERLLRRCRLWIAGGGRRRQ